MGLPEREALKLEDLWSRDEIGVELSVEVRAPVVVGVYPMRIARYVMDGNGNNFHAIGHAAPNGADAKVQDRPHAGRNGQHPPAQPAESAPSQGNRAHP